MMEICLNDTMRFSAEGKSLQDLLKSLQEDVLKAMKKIKKGGRLPGWAEAVKNENEARKLMDFASKHRVKMHNAVILGIGGSSLGPKALYNASYYPLYLLPGWKPERGMRLIFLDNSDPFTVSAVLDGIDFTKTLFVVISKSGSTAETVSQFMIAWEIATAKLGRNASEHFVFITDPEKGELRSLGTELKVPMFEIPQDVGGRFSVFTPVGLLPSALAGIDVIEIIEAGSRVMDRCLDEDISRNPATIMGACAYLMDREFGKRIHVLMPYSDRLASTAEWFVQLWAESLGKVRGTEKVGPTPIAARGATDQHSLLQLLKEGPSDKFVIFVGVRNNKKLKIPPIFNSYKAFEYLGGKGMEELIFFQMKSTMLSIRKSGTPTVEITVDDPGPAGAASLMAFFEVAVSIAGILYGIDPFNQPGVEESKKFTKALLGCKGMEEIAENLRNEIFSKSQVNYEFRI